jgi:aspartate ammonia-lyase
MRNACNVLTAKCVTGITANKEQLRWFVENSIGLVTALVPTLGYDNATEIAAEALVSGRGVYEIVLEKGLLEKKELDRIMNAKAMTGPLPLPPRS